MLRKLNLFNTVRRMAATSIQVKQSPVTIIQSGQHYTSMIYDTSVFCDTTNKTNEMAQQFVVPHVPIKDFADLCEVIKSLSPCDAAMVAIASRDVIPATDDAVNQLKQEITPTYDLDAYLRSELHGIYEEKIKQEVENLAKTSPLTGYY